MMNSDALLPGSARHTFEGADGMLVIECGFSEWITESLFNDRVRRHFKMQNYVTKFYSAAKCDGSDKIVSILATPTSWGCDPAVRKAYIADTIPQCRSVPVTSLRSG
jgi:hypothetical protein